ncbi:response regulator [Pseudidiomarina taiwanensis]|uniref:Response regulatory domain-containing protein n=1 Tax=Pseudidiomarina taiwanensis TaxID=337250 RepID=A0A432ZFH1_9GAMM|nr:response regulator [Pseudidiomarina taiwanensis]RUO76671.1 hypothetical protein CWI83_07020 [Pseudidiomarina taiwanensis]
MAFQRKRKSFLPTNADVLKGRKILLVEDHQVSQRMTSFIVEQEGVDCVAVGTGEEALEQFATNDFDVVLMDINLPKMSGEDAIIGIREFEEANLKKRTPIIVVTGTQAAPKGPEVSLFHGAEAVVIKPFTRYELLDKMTKVLTR